MPSPEEEEVKELFEEFGLLLARTVYDANKGLKKGSAARAAIRNNWRAFAERIIEWVKED